MKSLGFDQPSLRQPLWIFQWYDLGRLLCTSLPKPSRCWALTRSEEFLLHHFVEVRWFHVISTFDWRARSEKMLHFSTDLAPGLCTKALDDLFDFFFQDLCRSDWSSPITLQGTQGTSNAPGFAPPNSLVLLPGNSCGPPVPASGKVSEAVPWLWCLLLKVMKVEILFYFEVLGNEKRRAG